MVVDGWTRWRSGGRMAAGSLRSSTQYINRYSNGLASTDLGGFLADSDHNLTAFDEPGWANSGEGSAQSANVTQIWSRLGQCWSNTRPKSGPNRRCVVEVDENLANRGQHWPNSADIGRTRALADVLGATVDRMMNNNWETSRSPGVASRVVWRTLARHSRVTKTPHKPAPTRHVAPHHM